MRSGAIRPAVQTRDLDRRTVSYALWEQAGGISPDLPWTPAASFSEDETAQILSGASTAALVIGRGKEAGALLNLLWRMLRDLVAFTATHLRYGKRTGCSSRNWGLCRNACWFGWGWMHQQTGSSWMGAELRYCFWVPLAVSDVGY